MSTLDLGEADCKISVSPSELEPRRRHEYVPKGPPGKLFVSCMPKWIKNMQTRGGFLYNTDLDMALGVNGLRR